MTADATHRLRCVHGHGVFTVPELVGGQGQWRCPVCPPGRTNTLVPATHLLCSFCRTFGPAAEPCRICESAATLHSQALAK